MNRRRKLLAVIIGVPVLLVVIAAVVLPILVDSSHYKGRVTALVKEETGLDLRIDGAVRLRLLPEPSVTVTDVHLGNPPGFAGADLASLSALAVELRLWPLIQGRLVTRGLAVQGLVLNLERDARGHGNWRGLERAGQPTEVPQAEAIDAMVPAMVIAGLDIRDATINWRDPDTGAVTTIARADVTTGMLDAGKGVDDVRLHVTLPDAGAQTGPATIEVLGDVTLSPEGTALTVPDLSVTVAQLTVAGIRIDGDLGAALSADVEQQRLILDDLRASAEAFDGDAARATLEIITRLEFDLAGGRLAETPLSVKVPAYSVPGFVGDMTLDGVLKGDLNAGTWALDGIRSLATARAGGDPDDVRTFRLNADLELNENERTLTAKHVQLSVPDRRVRGELTLSAVRSGMAGMFDLHVDEQQLKGNFSIAESSGGVDLQLDLVAELDVADGRFALRGRNELDVHATVERTPEEERYRISSLQMSAQLADPSFPDGRLAVELRADVDVDLKDETVRSDNLQVRLDESRIAGSVGIRRFDVPAVRFDLEADAIDADRLMPRAEDGDADATTTLGATITAIRGLDLDGKVRVGTLTIEGVQMNNVRLTSRGGTTDQ